MTRERVHRNLEGGAADAGLKSPVFDPPDVALETGAGGLAETRDETIRRSIAMRDQGTPGMPMGKARLGRPRRRSV